MSDFSPTRAVVTGADSGIGKATALALARAGMDVGITWHRDEAGAHATAAGIAAVGRRAELAHIDLAEPEVSADAVDELMATLGGVDVFVNNAGVGSVGRFVDLGYDEWRRVLSVDLDGAFLCMQRAARRMVAQGSGGRIVAVTSVHEHFPLAGSAAYCAAKGGLGLLTQVMAVELSAYGITVNAVAPGEIATPMNDMGDVDPHTVHRDGIPLGRPGDAREVAAVIAFLASPQSSYVTGASWLVDGGMTRMGPLAARMHGSQWRGTAG